jgi:protein SCO1/2
MENRIKAPKLLILIVAITIVFFAMALIVINWANISEASIPVLGIMPQFEFINQDTQPYGTEQMYGKINVVDFIFTNCKGPCPIMAVNMGQLYSAYEGSDKVQFVSVSVDPDRDTPEVLKQYSSELGVENNQWNFLRAPTEEVIALLEQGFMLPGDNLPGGHTTRFVLIDHKGQIRGYFDGLSESSMIILIDKIKNLAREMP